MEDEFVKGTRERADEAISEQICARLHPGRRIGRNHKNVFGDTCEMSVNINLKKVEEKREED